MNLNFHKSYFKEFALALAAILSAVVITLFIPSLSDGGMYFLFLTAIIFSTLQGDVRSGIFAAVISIIVNLLLLYYLGKFPMKFGDWLVLIAFGLASGFTVLICYAQMESEIARRLAESKYRMIFEGAITGIYETTVDGKYIAANPKLAIIFGYETPADLIREVDDLNAGFYVEAGRRAEFIRLVSENGQISGFESEIYRRDGEKIWITENSVAVRDKNHKLIGFQGTSIEITDRKNAEASLQKAHEQLEVKVINRTADLEKANQILREEIAERQRIENELLASQLQLRDFSAHLESVREEERKYIARELHDELGQMLTALKIDLTKLGERIPNLQNETVRAQIIERVPAMLEVVDMAMETTRKIVTRLRPAVLDELGLAAAAEWQIREFQKRTGIKCDAQINFNEKNLPQQLNTAMFRILQECLTNIIRHANATNVKIEFKDEDDFLLLKVEDNGRGIGKNKLEDTRSFGISGMRERALLLGGTLEINRNGKSGTRVTVRVPSEQIRL